MYKKNIYISILLIFIFLFSGSGCTKTALRMTSELFDNLSLAVFEECDPELAEKAIPSNLILLEGVLKNDPENSNLLKLLTMGFCGYSMLYVENMDDERASDLYFRAMKYGFKSLGFNGAPENITQKNIDDITKSINNKKIDCFLWTTVAWSSWINLNLHKPASLAQLGMVQSCIDKLTEAHHDLFYCLPDVLKAVSLSARPAMLGGDYEKAKEYYEKALLVNNRSFFLTQYYYARYYCVGVQDKEMYVSLLNEIIENKKEIPEDLCLINNITRIKAEQLLEDIDEYFF